MPSLVQEHKTITSRNRFDALVNYFKDTKQFKKKRDFSTWLYKCQKNRRKNAFFPIDEQMHLLFPMKDRSIESVVTH